MEKRTITPICRWTQGYICAVCCMINLNGQVETATRELFIAGVGNKTLNELMAAGVDEQDLKILEANWKELH